MHIKKRVPLSVLHLPECMVICWSSITSHSPINGCFVNGCGSIVDSKGIPQECFPPLFVYPKTEQLTIIHADRWGSIVGMDRTPLGVHSPIAHPPITNSCGHLPQPTTQPSHRPIGPGTKGMTWFHSSPTSIATMMALQKVSPHQWAMSHSLCSIDPMSLLIYYHITWLLKATTQSKDHTKCLSTSIMLCCNHLCTRTSSRDAASHNPASTLLQLTWCEQQRLYKPPTSSVKYLDHNNHP